MGRPRHEDLRDVGIDGCYCEPTHPAEPCPNCGGENNGELHLPEYTLLCYVCETRFPVTNPLGRV